MPNFSVSDSNSLFLGAFAIKLLDQHVAVGEEQSYLAELDEIMRMLADEVPDPEPGKAPTPRDVVRRDARDYAVRQLRKNADEFVAGTLSAATGARNVLVIKGKYRRDVELLGSVLFTIGVKDDGGSPPLATELTMSVGSPPGVSPTPEQQKLFAAVQNVELVVKAVCQRIAEGANADENARSKRLCDEFIRKLAGLAKLGLEEPHVQLATLGLDGLKGEFQAREAGRIKNGYMRRLGSAAIIAGAGATALYAFAKLVGDGASVDLLKNNAPYFLVCFGAAIGAWLSFAIRRVTLAFEDLAAPEADLLDPALRLVFVILLATTVYLMFKTGLVKLEIGSLKTAELVGHTAVLVGIFCGIAERALATAISGRADTFVRTSISG